MRLFSLVWLLAAWWVVAGLLLAFGRTYGPPVMVGVATCYLGDLHSGLGRGLPRRR